MTSIDPRVHIGHVHLTVSHLERALAFYRDVLGFEVTTRYGGEAGVLSAGGLPPPHRGNTPGGGGAPPPPPGGTRVYHLPSFLPPPPALWGAARGRLPPRHP